MKKPISLLILMTIVMLSHQSCTPKKPAPTTWMEAFVGDDESPAVFRGIKMGDSREQVMKAPDVQIQHDDERGMTISLIPAGIMDGSGFFTFKENNIVKINLNFYSPDAAALSDLWNFLQKHYVAKFGPAIQPDPTIYNWPALKDKGPASASLRLIELNNLIDITFTAE